MTLLGRRLIGPRVAAVILTLYALFYALAPLGMLLEAPFSPGSVFPLALLALACTPIAAGLHLWRAVSPGPKRPSRPGVMALVMALPSAFWSFLTVPWFFEGNDIRLWWFLFAGMPATLSLWLMITFILLWRRDRRAKAQMPRDGRSQD